MEVGTPGLLSDHQRASPIFSSVQLIFVQKYSILNVFESKISIITTIGKINQTFFSTLDRPFVSHQVVPLPGHLIHLCLSCRPATIMENHETLMKDCPADGTAKAITKGDIITSVTPEKKTEEEKAEQGYAEMDAAETPEPTASTPQRHDTKVNVCPTGALQEYVK